MAQDPQTTLKLRFFLLLDRSPTKAIEPCLSFYWPIARAKEEMDSYLIQVDVLN